MTPNYSTDPQVLEIIRADLYILATRPGQTREEKLEELYWFRKAYNPLGDGIMAKAASSLSQDVKQQLRSLIKQLDEVRV